GVAAKEPREFLPEDLSELEGEMLKVVEDDLRAAYKITDKQARYDAVDAAKARGKEVFLPEGAAEHKWTAEQVATVFKALQAKVVSWNSVDTRIRIDGRDVERVRPIVAEVGVLPRTHGSALFPCGETQALVVATLGTGEDARYIDALTGTYEESFLLHY